MKDDFDLNCYKCFLLGIRCTEAHICFYMIETTVVSENIFLANLENKNEKCQIYKY
jgi:hypothetical protein